MLTFVRVEFLKVFEKFWCVINVHILTCLRVQVLHHAASFTRFTLMLRSFFIACARS